MLGPQRAHASANAFAAAKLFQICVRARAAVTFARIKITLQKLL
jgi:hypothetical protein